jgi:hypothetical protein
MVNVAAKIFLILWPSSLIASVRNQLQLDFSDLNWRQYCFVCLYVTVFSWKQNFLNGLK